MEKITDEQLKKELSFDLYGRYAIIRDIIDHNRKEGESFKVLDVGGRGNLFKRFLPNDHVFYLDPLVDSKDENFIKGDGCAIPLGDGEFDWVTSADVFEHIPKEKRRTFLDENIRVAKLGTILVAPFWSKEVEQAEINANENYKILSGGKDHMWLREHIENGLPDMAEVEKSLKEKKLPFQKLYNNRLFLWQSLIDVSFLVSVNRYEDIIKRFDDFNYFYNTEIYPFDNQEPSYRKAYFIKKDPSLHNIKVGDMAIDDGLLLGTIKKGFELANTIDDKNRGIIGQKDLEIRSKNKEIKNKNQITLLKDRELFSLNQIVLQRDQEAQSNSQELGLIKTRLDSISTELNSTKTQLDFKTGELSEIHRSKGWRLVIFTRKIFNTIFPRGSLRRKIVAYFVMSVKKSIKSFFQIKRSITFYGRLVKKVPFVIKRDGLFVFIRKAYRHFIRRTKHLAQKDYDLWISNNERFDNVAVKDYIRKFKYKPKISIITPVYNVDPKWLDKCIQSVINQFYENWELCLHDDASIKRETVECLKKWDKVDSRIKISYGKENQHISGASNSSLKLATGEFIALLDNDDELSPHALYENVKLLNEKPDLDFIYSDEDKLEMDGTRVDAFFKPDWSPDLFLSMMYTCHLGIYRKSIIDKIGGFRKGFDGSQDYDLVLRFVERVDSKNIFHIPMILYHWREIPGSTAAKSEAKDYAYTAAKMALSEYLDRNNIKGDIFDGKFTGSYRIKRKIIGNDKVSIIIPFKDQVDILKKCINSIKQKTTYKNYEIILVDNQSREADTFDYIGSLKKEKNISVLGYDKPFNFSAINNIAVKKAKGVYMLFLNNDTEIINAEWLSSMVEHIQRDEVGAVGAKLIYPNDTIQHTGVIMGLGIASHAFRNFSRESHGYFGLLNVIRNCSAVTGACLLTKKKLFEELGGFDEKNLAIAYNDVDYCLEVIKRGQLVIFTPFAELYHHESVSRGDDESFKFTDPARYQRFISEKEFIVKKWRKYIENDPYYNPNLTRNGGHFGIRFD
jgi:GT2 family glycosyltransferase